MARQHATRLVASLPAKRKSMRAASTTEAVGREGIFGIELDRNRAGVAGEDRLTISRGLHCHA
jgi:hypothetical protein